MSGTGKIRVYDLAKSLIPEGMSEKDKKAFQTQKTKDILEACGKLGLPNKAPSSSVQEDIVPQVLSLINNQPSADFVPASSSKPQAAPKSSIKANTKTEKTTEKAEEKAEPKKKSRILRRIKVEAPVAEVEEEEVSEEAVIQESSEESYDVSSVEVQENQQLVDEVVNDDVEDNLDSEELPQSSTSTLEDLQETDLMAEGKVDSSPKSQPVSEISKKAEPKTYNKPFVSPIQIIKSENTIQSPPPGQRFQNQDDRRHFDRSKRKPGHTQLNQQPGHQPNHQSNHKFGQPARPSTSQPYRVAKPINTSFSPIRRKPGQKQRQKGNQQNKAEGGFQVKDKASALKEVERPTELTINHPLTIKELSELLFVQETEIIRILFMKGIMRTVNQTLEVDLTIQVGEELGCKITMDQSKADQSDDLASRLKVLVDKHTDDEQTEDLKIRPPVVTIMGHVDHGKTTLLDSIRKSKKQITSTESGGITQHIGAYQITVKDYDDKDRKITFLDTPGHEAFTALRSRGAQATDIAILVVAADDGVMPQTIEAISHAKAAGVPLIVAVNKIDKPDSTPEKVLSQLIEHEVVVEDYGGSIVCSKISAKQNLNLDDLLSKITLVADAELGDKLLANPKSRAVGAVIEAALTANRGTVTSLLVQSGTLRKGDTIAAGATFGRVRAIFDDEGNEIEEAPPATPVQILGLDSVPQAGDTFQVFKNMQKAKAQAEKVKEQAIDQKRMNRGLEYFSSEIREGNAKELSVIIKADVHGSAEAIANELNKLSSEQALVKIVHCAAGAVSEADINLASATNSIVVNFNTFIDSATSKAAADNNVPVYDCTIIYEITESVRKAINGLLEPEKIDVKYGEAQVRQLFSAGKSIIAGSYVTSGKVVRGSNAKVIREGKEVTLIRLDNLRRFKDDVKEVVEGYECGISFDSFNDLEEGDIIESWGTEFQERTI